MGAFGTKLTFRLTLDSRGDKASPMRRGTSATESAWRNRGSPPRSKDETGSGQVIEERLGLLQVKRVEAFGEPAIDGREQVASLGALALIAPEAGEVESCTQLPEFGALPLRHCYRVVKTIFRSGVLVHDQQ